MHTCRLLGARDFPALIAIAWVLLVTHPCFALDFQSGGGAAPSSSDSRKPTDVLILNLPAAVAGTPAGNPGAGLKSTGTGAGGAFIRSVPGSGIRWRRVFLQSGLFLGVEHGFRFATQPGTREALRGPYFKDWFSAVRATRGWGDGDDFLTNYIGHPMQGAVTGYIFVQNHPGGRDQVFGRNLRYWKSRLGATVWSAVYSTLFELGPASEASLGNVGYNGTSLSGAVDLVVTPVAGLGWQIGEDALDKYLIARIERRTTNPVILLLSRGFLNPTRSFANVMRLKLPWHRDTRPGIWNRDSLP